MNVNNPDKWQHLLALSAPTFAGDASPPYGFVTSTLTRLNLENQQLKEIERIGWRALLASLAALALAAAVTVTIDFKKPALDLEPGEKSLIQMENISIS